MKQAGYFQLFDEVYRMLQKYGNVQNADDYWNALIDEADRICKKYCDTAIEGYAKKLLVDTLNELEEKMPQKH